MWQGDDVQGRWLNPFGKLRAQLEIAKPISGSPKQATKMISRRSISEIVEANPHHDGADEPTPDR